MEKMMVNGPAGKVEIKTRKKFLVVAEASVVIFWPTQGFSGRTFISPGFSTKRDINFCAHSAPLGVVGQVTETR